MPEQAKQNHKETRDELHARVSTLLQASIAAHVAYRDATRQKDRPAALKALTEAQAKRQLAHDADPQHTAPIWQATGKLYPHDALLVFYTEQLERR